MDKYLNEDAITAEIVSYAKSRIYNYAVLIDGDWGSGKTYFVQNQLIPKLEASEYSPIYISLYGIDSTESVSQKIALFLLLNKVPTEKKSVVKQCLPVIGSFVLPIGQTLLNISGLSILEPLLKPSTEDIPWEKILTSFSDSKPRIFIFDDLERCSLPINEILGYINGLVEHGSEKVIIVANQKAIGKMSLRNDLEAKYQVVLNPQLHLTEKVRDPSQPHFTSQNNLVDQHITKFTPDQLKQRTAELFSENVLYKEIKEKLVGQELYFHPTLEKTLPLIIAESSLDEEVKGVLAQTLDKIVHVFRQENCLNLRSFQSALLTFNRIWNLPFEKNINTLDRCQLLEDLFIAILHSTMQQKKGGHRHKWEQGKSYAKYCYSENPLDFTRWFLGFRFVEDYIFDSTLNSENAISTINAYVQNEITKPREKSHDPLQKTTNYWLMSDEDVESLHKELYDCIGTHDYTLIELFKLLSFAYKLSDLGFSVDVDQFFQKIHDAVDKMSPLSRKFMGYFQLSMLDGSLLSSDSPSFPAFKQRCDQLLDLMKRNSHKTDDVQIAALFKEENGWGQKFYEYVTSNRDAFLSDKAFLSKFDMDVLIEKLRISSPDDWYAFRRAISLVYDLSGFGSLYYDDLEPAKMLKKNLEDIVLPSKLINNTQKKWLIEFLQEIIAKLTSQSPNGQANTNNTVDDATSSSS